MNRVTEEEAKEINRKYYRYDQIASQRVKSLEEITDEQLRLYKKEGYLIVENFLTPDEVVSALQEINDIIHGKLQGPKVQLVKPESELKTMEQRENACRKVYNFTDFAPFITNITFGEKMIALVEMILGDKAKLVDDEAHLKPPFGGGEKPWHQDMAYGGLFYQKQIVTVWIALDEAGLDNGCMHIIPGSHLNGGVPHYKVRDWQICDTSVDVARDEAATLKPGGALIFSGLLHHGTPSNFSSKKRRALQLRYAPGSSNLMTKKQYKLMFTSEMTDAEC